MEEGLSYSRTLWQKVWTEEFRSQIASKEQRRTRRIVETLLSWRATKNAIAAAIIAPILSHSDVSRDLLLNLCDMEAVDLAQRLVDTQKGLALNRNSRFQPDSVQRSQDLGRLYRQVYLDLPSSSFTLLLLADYDSRLADIPKLSKQDAFQTQKVFAPLAEMLGIWSLYRRWTEKSYSVLFPEQYSDMRRLLGPPENYSKIAFKNLLVTHRETTNRRNKAESAADDQEGTENKNLLNKAKAFLSFRRNALKIFHERGIKARLIPIRHYPGLALRRVREGESREEVARRLSVRILCRSATDCYSVLGIIHSLGKPVSLNSVLNFNDHIASPQPNGYQALHAAITYRDFKKEKGGSAIVIECRILTTEMYKLNERGILEALSGVTNVKSPIQSWWNQLDELNRQFKKSVAREHFPSIQAYLSANEPGLSSNPLYVFTPRGEIVLLVPGSTPLDFAYTIHRKMGHHAIRVEVNGQNVPHGYQLCNADIVRIYHDPAFAGPDFSWLWLVATPVARASIRRGLAWRAHAAHEGRAYFEKSLLRSLDRYEREKRYRISLTTERVDDFLLERSRVFGYSEISELYSKLSSEQRAGTNSFAQVLVQDLLSEELASNITLADGTALSYELRQVAVCQSCFPFPGEAIIGFEHTPSKTKKRFTVHKDGKQICVSKANTSKQVRLVWAKKASFDQNELIVFRIKGLDRSRLLREVIDVVYQVPGSYLYKVSAQRYGDSHADISMVTKAKSFDSFAEIEKRLRRVAGVIEIMQNPPSPSQQIALSIAPFNLDLAYPGSPVPNPYTSEEVFQRGIFYDREELLSSLLNWLRETPASEARERNPMILHGQRRIGKTSLVKFLIFEYLPSHRFVQPVFVDLQGLDEFAPSNLANFIVMKVFKEIKRAAPPRNKDEEAWDWVDRCLVEALKHAPRLLIVIDEFNALIDVEREGRLNPVIYTNLRYIMNAHRYINWLLVVQDTHYLDDAMWLSAGVLFQKVQELQVTPLDRDWARRLILEPARKCGVLPQNEDYVIDEVLRLTAGSPFLIQLICRELVQGVRDDGRLKIIPEDIAAAAGVINHAGKRWYNHFMKNLTGMREVVMAAVATLLKTRLSVGETKVVSLLSQKIPDLNHQAVQKILIKLAQEGLIALSGVRRRGLNRVTIPIELFRQFIVEELDLNESIDKWHQSRSLRLKVGRKEGK